MFLVSAINLKVEKHHICQCVRETMRFNFSAELIVLIFWCYLSAQVGESLAVRSSGLYRNGYVGFSLFPPPPLFFFFLSKSFTPELYF